MFFLGLDSAPPKTLYEQYGVSIPSLGEIISESSRWIMRSCHPPITIPAWMVMFTGKTPGELGIYGFRHRKPGDVGYSYIVNYSNIKEETLWDKIGKTGGRIGLFGVPPTWPPRPLRGFIITDFMTPSKKNYTFPPWLKKEIEEKFGTPIFDVKFRREDKIGVRKEIYKMTQQHMKIVKYLVGTKKWDLFVYVEIGVDRIHHAFWKYFDTSHPRYTFDPDLSTTIPEYYRLIDNGFDSIKRELPKDTIIVLASDHGIKPMTGAFAINEWLIDEGYLTIKSQKDLKPGTELSKDNIVWERTLAWAWGGYYSRIFLNLKGREPKGIIESEEAESLIKQLISDISRIRGPGGEIWRNLSYRPHEIYPHVRGDPPDLMVYLDDLSWRAAGTVGWNTPYLFENDRGPDDAVHSWDGVFTIYDPEETLTKGMKGVISIDKIAPLLQEIIKS